MTTVYALLFLASVAWAEVNDHSTTTTITSPQAPTTSLAPPLEPGPKLSEAGALAIENALLQKRLLLSQLETVQGQVRAQMAQLDAAIEQRTASEATANGFDPGIVRVDLPNRQLLIPKGTKPKKVRR